MWAAVSKVANKNWIVSTGFRVKTVYAMAPNKNSKVDEVEARLTVAEKQKKKGKKLLSEDCRVNFRNGDRV